MAKRGLIILTFIFSGVLAANCVLAAAIGVKPQSLDIVSVVGVKNEHSLLVKNTGDEPALYMVHPDSTENNILIEPSDFKLYPGEEVRISLVSSFWLPREIFTNISILARSINAGGIAAVPGVKIPCKISVKFSISQKLLITFLLALLICLVMFFVLKLKKSKQKI